MSTITDENADPPVITWQIGCVVGSCPAIVTGQGLSTNYAHAEAMDAALDAGWAALSARDIHTRWYCPAHRSLMLMR